MVTTPTPTQKLPDPIHVRLEDLVIDEDLQPRMGLDPTAVEHYAAIYDTEGVGGLPDLLAFRENGRIVLIAGRHRIAAAEIAGLPTLPVVVIECDRRTAYEKAVSSNTRGPVRYRTVEVERIAARVLSDPHYAAMSNRELGRLFGIGEWSFRARKTGRVVRDYVPVPAAKDPVRQANGKKGSEKKNQGKAPGKRAAPPSGTPAPTAAPDSAGAPQTPVDPPAPAACAERPHPATESITGPTIVSRDPPPRVEVGHIPPDRPDPVESALACRPAFDEIVRTALTLARLLSAAADSAGGHYLRNLTVDVGGEAVPVLRADPATSGGATGTGRVRYRHDGLEQLIRAVRAAAPARRCVGRFGDEGHADHAECCGLAWIPEAPVLRSTPGSVQLRIPLATPADAEE